MKLVGIAFILFSLLIATFVIVRRFRGPERDDTSLPTDIGALRGLMAPAPSNIPTPVEE